VRIFYLSEEKKNPILPELIGLLTTLVGISIMIIYLTNLRIGISNCRIPYWWVFLLPLAFIPEGFFFEKAIVIGLISLLTILISSRFDVKTELSHFFFSGVMTGIPFIFNHSPFIILPVIMVQILVVFPFSGKRIASFILGYSSFLIWAAAIYYYQFNNISWTIYPDTFISNKFERTDEVLWVIPLLILYTLGIFNILNILPIIKVIHRKVYSCQIIVTFFWPWFILNGFTTREALMLIMPGFVFISLAAFNIKYKWSSIILHSATSAGLCLKIIIEHL